MALKDKKLSHALKPDPVLSAEIERLKNPDGTVFCLEAIGLAEKMRIRPEKIGRTLDALAVPLSRCQIGAFGYPGRAKGWSADPSGPVPEGLEEAIRAAAGSEKRIRCLRLWELAERFRISRMDAGRTADRAGVKIVSCQLGAF